MKLIDKDRWINDLVSGKSFADVGGLWNTTNEKISVAAKAGASSLTMIDIQQPGNIWWQRFAARMKDLGISNYHSIVANAVSDDFSRSVSTYDIVYCTGIIYHLPSPYELLSNLRKITNEYLILGAMTVPEHIENELGTIELDGGKTMFIPSMSEEQRAITKRHFETLRVNTAVITDYRPEALLKDDGTTAYGPWWFLMTATYIIGLAKTLHFEIVDYGEAWAGRTHGFLLKKIP